MIISIVQDGPVFNNKKQTIQKTIELVGQAKKGGADLVVFGETWLCGYPVWIDICRDAALWDHEPVKSIWADMYDSAIDLSSRDFDKLKKVVTDEKIWAVMGMNEKITKGPGNGTLINAVLTISDKGEIVNHHRKLMPSYSEKLVHGVGDGAALNNVKTPFGNLGALICWEHWMPMARAGHARRSRGPPYRAMALCKRNAPGMQQAVRFRRTVSCILSRPNYEVI